MKDAKMSDDWEEDDNDWDYEYEELVVVTGGCPECGAEIDVEAEVCPSCGYWLTTAERHTLWDADSPAKGGDERRQGGAGGDF